MNCGEFMDNILLEQSVKEVLQEINESKKRVQNIGKGGIEKVVEIKLNKKELEMFKKSVETVRQLNAIASKME